MIKLTQEELNSILEKHKLWLKNKPAGIRADLRDADLSGADLRDAALRDAALSGADLSGADLSGADLSGADLSGADLSGASTDKKYIQVSCIGSEKRRTIYCVDDDEIFCGCWYGSLKEFKSRIKEVYPNIKNIHHKEYIGLVKYLESLL